MHILVSVLVSRVHVSLCLHPVSLYIHSCVSGSVTICAHAVHESVHVCTSVSACASLCAFLCLCMTHLCTSVCLYAACVSEHLCKCRCVCTRVLSVCAVCACACVPSVAVPHSSTCTRCMQGSLEPHQLDDVGDAEPGGRLDVLTSLHEALIALQPEGQASDKSPQGLAQSPGRQFGTAAKTRRIESGPGHQPQAWQARGPSRVIHTAGKHSVGDSPTLCML